MTSTFANWIQYLLGISTESGEGTAWNIEFSGQWPAWVTLLFALFAVTFVAAVYRRHDRGEGRGYRTVLAVMRLAATAVVVLMISQVTLSLKRTGLPYVAVLLDDSLSMTTVDAYPEKSREAMFRRVKNAEKDNGGLSRWNLARTLLAEKRGNLLRGMAGEHKLQLSFLSGAQPGRLQDIARILEAVDSVAPTGQQTRLGDGIRNVLDELRGTTPAALVLVSDGINTDGSPLTEAATYARRRGVPLFTIGLGSAESVRDLKLSDLVADEVVFVDDVMNFECKLTADGFQGEKVTVVLREKDDPKVLAKVETTIEADPQSQQVRLPLRPTRTGQFEFVVEAGPGRRELQTENNRLTRTVQVRKEKIRVLLVQGYPSFEFRYLTNMLKRDDTITLHTVLQEADLEHAEQDTSALRAFPLRREDLFTYDVVIFGDVNPSLLSPSALQNVADFVDQPTQGGALIVLAGPSYMPTSYMDTPLARLLPFAPAAVRPPERSRVLATGFVIEPTDLGLASPPMQLGDSPTESLAIWRRLPPLYWLLELGELKPGVRVLAEHPSRLADDGRHLPVFCLQYVGAGKVLFHATDETWRWRYRIGDLYFARYWGQTIRYLCRAKLTDADRPVTLTTDHREYLHGETVRLRARFADERLAPAEDDGVRVVVELPGRQRERLSLRRTAGGRGVFEGELNRPAPGDYHAWIVAPDLKGQTTSADFSVTPPAGEFAQTRTDATALERLAKETGGRSYTFESADRLPRDLPAGRPVPIESLAPVPLWNKWPLLALFLALLTGEWILRKRGDMV